MVCGLSFARVSVLTGTLVFILSGCLGGYPLGMKEKEWLELTPQQRIEAREKQGKLNNERAEKRAAAERIEQDRIDRIYSEGAPGDVIQCVLEGGNVHSGSKITPHKPLAFRLARGEKKYVQLDQIDGFGVSGSARFWTEFDRNAMQLNVCPYNPGFSLNRNCQSFTALSRDFAQGKSWPLDIKDVLSGATLRCGLPLGKHPKRNIPSV